MRIHVQINRIGLVCMLPTVAFGLIAVALIPATAQVDALKQVSDTAAQKTNASAVNPFQFDKLDLALGYLLPVTKDGKNKFYYNLSYDGNPISKKGVAFSPADVLKPLSALTAQLPNVNNPGGDSQTLSITFQQGSGILNSGLFNALGVQPLRFNSSSLFVREIRGTLQFSGRLDGKQTNVAGGIETPPLHPVSFLPTNLRAGVTNWLTFGAAMEDQPQSTAASGNRAVPMLTYRAFIGKAFGVKPRAGIGKSINGVFLKTAPTYDAGLAIVQKNTPPKDLLPNDEAVVVQAVLEHRSDLDALKKAYDDLPAGAAKDKAKKDLQSEWEKDIDAITTGFQKGFSLRPDHTFWIESSAWYALSQQTGTSARFNNLFAATYTYWINPDSTTPYWFRIRYESGRQRAAPTVNLNQVLFMVGKSF
jgi:hypothetical protein